MTILGTNVCIGIIRGDRNVIAAYRRNAGNVAISAMTVGKLFYGAEKSMAVEKNRKIVERFVDAIPVVHTSNAIMRRFAVEKARLSAQGRPVEDVDVIIAATALALGSPVATSNTRHLSRFPDLVLENWFDA